MRAFSWQPPQRRRLWLMRHGAVEYFTNPGADFSSPVLSARGADQARAAGTFFEKIPIDRVITSGLVRTRQTAELAFPSLPAGEDPDWREIEPAPLPGPGSGQTLDPAAFQAVLRTLGPGLTPESRFLGGESFGLARARVVEALSRLVADSNWSQALVVAHSVSIRLALLHFLDAPLDSLCRLEQDTGCINLVELDPAGFPLVRLVNLTPPSLRKEEYRHSALEELLLQYLSKKS